MAFNYMLMPKYMPGLILSQRVDNNNYKSIYNHPPDLSILKTVCKDRSNMELSYFIDQSRISDISAGIYQCSSCRDSHDLSIDSAHYGCVLDDSDIVSELGIFRYRVPWERRRKSSSSPFNNIWVIHNYVFWLPLRFNFHRVNIFGKCVGFLIYHSSGHKNNKLAEFGDHLLDIHCQISGSLVIRNCTVCKFTNIGVAIGQSHMEYRIRHRQLSVKAVFEPMV